MGAQVTSSESDLRIFFVIKIYFGILLFKMSLQDKILKRKLKKKEKQKLKIIEERKANPTIESTEEESEQQNEITESDVENHGTKRKIEDSDVEPVKKSKK